MAIEPLREENNESFRVVKPADQPSSPDLSLVPHFEVAAENARAARPIDKQKLLQMARELCVEPGVPPAVAWEHMKTLLQEQFKESEFTYQLSDPQTTIVTTGDIINSYFGRRKSNSIRIAKSMDITPQEAALKALNQEFARPLQERVNMARFYNEKALKTKEPYFQYIDQVFSSSDHEQKAKALQKVLRKRRK